MFAPSRSSWGKVAPLGEERGQRTGFRPPVGLAVYFIIIFFCAYESACLPSYPFLGRRCFCFISPFLHPPSASAMVPPSSPACFAGRLADPRCSGDGRERPSNWTDSLESVGRGRSVEARSAPQCRHVRRSCAGSVVRRNYEIWGPPPSACVFFGGRLVVDAPRTCVPVCLCAERAGGAAGAFSAVIFLRVPLRPHYARRKQTVLR